MSGEAKKIQSFGEFWPFYVGEHRLPMNRMLHYFGTSFALICLLSAAATGDWRMAVAAPFAGYGPAWIGHFVLEKNRPATFTYPVWSLLSDFKMLSFALRGKMDQEVTRLYGSPAPGREAPLLNLR
jgi:hypothetical protein